MKHLFLSIWFVCLSVASFCQLEVLSGNYYNSFGVGVLSDGEVFYYTLELSENGYTLKRYIDPELSDVDTPEWEEDYPRTYIYDAQAILRTGVYDTYFDTNPSTLEFYIYQRYYNDFGEGGYRWAIEIISINKQTLEEVDRWNSSGLIDDPVLAHYFHINKMCGTRPFIQIYDASFAFNGEVPCECSCDEVNMVGEHHRSTIDIYPSPALNFINIEGVDSFVAHKVQIFDVNGHVVKETFFDSRMNVQNLSSGMYTLRILDHDSKVISAGQFVKQ